MRADIVPGARFPDYELPDHTGRRRKLSELQGDAPMIVHLLREVSRRIHPEWDLSDPQLRAAWKAGNKSRFWPYGKSLQQVLAEQ